MNKQTIPIQFTARLAQLILAMETSLPNKNIPLFEPRIATNEHAKDVFLLLDTLKSPLTEAAVLKALTEIQQANPAENVPLNYATKSVLFASLVIRTEHEALGIIVQAREELMEKTNEFNVGEVQHAIDAFRNAWHDWQAIKVQTPVS